MRTLMVMLFLVFAIFAFTACTGTEEDIKPVEPEIVESTPEPPTPPPSDFSVTSTVVPPLVSEPRPLQQDPVSSDPAEDPPVDVPIVEDPPPTPYYAPNTVYISLNEEGTSEVQARGIAQRYTTKSTTVKSGFTGYHTTVQEGGIFRVRIDMEGRNLGGVDIINGGCTLHMHDSHGHTTIYEDVLNSQTFSTEHTHQDDEGRTALVTITGCNLPDLDDADIRYEIDRNNFNHQVTVGITTAGPLLAPVDDGVYTLTLDNLRVVGSRHYFDFVIDNAPPVQVNFRWKWTIVYHDVPEDSYPSDRYTRRGVDWHYYNAGVTGSQGMDKIADNRWIRWEVPEDQDETDAENPTYTWLWDMYWWPRNVDKTLTVTITRFEKSSGWHPNPYCGNLICNGQTQYYTPPGGTYSVGDTDSISIRFPAETE